MVDLKGPIGLRTPRQPLRGSSSFQTSSNFSSIRLSAILKLVDDPSSPTISAASLADSCSNLVVVNGLAPSVLDFESISLSYSFLVILNKGLQDCPCGKFAIRFYQANASMV
ncbi:hypothetical protein PGTUg99_016754 [Puccinia graminis f. sp. tritici]|uniref:Uncharacterized protein n=1 Tax=Puccinia graminis f. sp. tritici TaxID=56615 RepID=A0A5B0S9E6_PUCGR|nr:hypothetical protein PGTUg99_016754 [Puccinia graminis f. sp. tritici]